MPCKTCEEVKAALGTIRQDVRMLCAAVARLEGLASTQEGREMARLGTLGLYGMGDVQCAKHGMCAACGTFHGE